MEAAVFWNSGNRKLHLMWNSDCPDLGLRLFILWGEGRSRYLIVGIETRYLSVQKGEKFPDKIVVLLKTKLSSRSCSRLAKMVFEVVQDRSKWRLRLFGSFIS